MKYVFALFLILASPFALLSKDISENKRDSTSEKGNEQRVAFTFGALVYYAWWQPVWHETFESNIFYLSKGKYTNKDGSFLYGPVIQLNFMKGWSMSGSFLYGSYIYKYEGIGASFGNPIADRWERKSEKFDADLLFGKLINKHMKIYFGPKYQGYNYRNKGYTTMAGYILPMKEHLEYHSLGLGLGLGFIIPIVQNFYLMPNISTQALTLLTQKSDYRPELLQQSIAVGGNMLLSLAYYIEKIHVTIALGGRFQYLYYITTPIKTYTNPHDMFYGVNLSLTYTF